MQTHIALHAHWELLAACAVLCICQCSTDYFVLSSFQKEAKWGCCLQKLKVLKPDEHPAAFRYFEEMKARPGYKKAVAG